MRRLKCYKVMYVILIMLVATWGSLPPKAATAAIILNKNLTQARALSFWDLDDQRSSSAAVPESYQLDATFGYVHSKNSFEWSESSGRTMFSIHMEHQRIAANDLSSAETYAFEVFTATSDCTYELSGYYNATEVGQSGRVYLRVYLKEVWADTNLFYNVQASNGVPDQQFILGQNWNNTDRALQGNLKGTLVAGEDYMLYVLYYISDYGDHPLVYPEYELGGATAIGSFTMKIDDVAVAEPNGSLLALCSLVAGAQVFFHRRSRN